MTFNVSNRNNTAFGNGRARLIELSNHVCTAPKQEIPRKIIEKTAYEIWQKDKNPNSEQNWEKAKTLLSWTKKLLQKAIKFPQDMPLSKLTPQNYQQFVDKEAAPRVFKKGLPAYGEVPMVVVGDKKVVPYMFRDGNFVRANAEEQARYTFARLEPVLNKPRVFAVKSADADMHNAKEHFDLYCGK